MSHSFCGIICAGTLLVIASSVRAQNLFVSTYASSIAEITPGGNVSTFASVPSPTLGLVFNNAGDLFAGINSLGTIIEITPNGTQSTYASGLKANGTIGLAINGASDLFIVSGSSVVEITPSGTESTYASGFYYPQDVAFDSAGDLFVSQSTGSQGDIIEIKPNGNQSIFANDSNPSGLAFNSAGDLFVGNNGSIYEITPDGTQSAFASGLSHATGLAFDSEGNLYVVDQNAGKVYEFAPDGTRTTVASDFSGSPSYIAIEPSSAVPESSAWGLLGAVAATFPVFRQGRKLANDCSQS